MSAEILGSISHDDLEGATYHDKAGTHGSGRLGSWSLQRLPHQRGLWYVSLHIRGLWVCGYAVQDDFGDLQMVAV